MLAATWFGAGGKCSRKRARSIRQCLIVSSFVIVGKVPGTKRRRRVFEVCNVVIPWRSTCSASAPLSMLVRCCCDATGGSDGRELSSCGSIGKSSDAAANGDDGKNCSASSSCGSIGKSLEAALNDSAAVRRNAAASARSDSNVARERSIERSIIAICDAKQASRFGE